MPTHCGMTGERIATAPADSVVQARVLSGFLLDGGTRFAAGSRANRSGGV